MIIDILLLIVGFILLIKGADIFVDGACSVAYRFHVPPLIVGLTIVAIGTSLPEAAVSVTAALNGSNAIAVSNIIGSNIFNILVVLGIVSLITVLPVSSAVVKREMPILLVSSLILTLMIYSNRYISRIEGLILFTGIVLYILLLVKQTSSQTVISEKVEPKLSLKMSILCVLGGGAGIAIGGDLVVNNARSIALMLGMSEKLVGLTIVSIGTSLPELVTGIVAARKGEVDVAVGNAIGSCIFNILFILGVSSLLSPIVVEPVLLIDTVVMCLVVMLIYYIIYKFKKIDKKAGLIMLALFVIYTAYIIMRN